MITASRLREVLHFNADNGDFKWIKVAPRWKYKIGSVAGNLNSTGYWVISVDGRKYKAHRLAWLYVHGEWPQNEIDHINGDKTDNRIVNLRLATRLQNSSNRKRYENNQSGYKGVSYSKRERKWRARIARNGRPHFLGHFETPELAYNAYCRAAKQLFGEFWRAA